MKTKVAILGSGNIGTDLMIKVLRTSKSLEVGVLVGVDPDSDGLPRGRRMGVPTLTGGIDDLIRWPGVEDIRMVFDATSARAHGRHSQISRTRGMHMVDLTPAAAGPYVVPVVNMGAHFDSPDISMVSCGGQATIPIVAAVSRVATVHYAEIVSSIASRSAGPGTRANIDEFTQTTSHAIETVGGARRGKAIIVLNPAEPPIMMRNTVFCLSDEADTAEIARSIDRMVGEVRNYVDGYRLKQEVQFDRIGADNAMILHGVGVFTGIKTSVFLEVEGSAHYLPAYAGNLDIMTSAALSTGERLAERNCN